MPIVIARALVHRLLPPVSLLACRYGMSFRPMSKGPWSGLPRVAHKRAREDDSDDWVDDDTTVSDRRGILMRLIEGDKQTSRIRETAYRMMLRNLELMRAMLLSPELESEEEDDDEQGGLGRRKKRRKIRQSYLITCAIRQTDWFKHLFGWDNNHFRVIYRMSKPTFWELVHILERNPLFVSKGKQKQRPVHFQLGVFLIRYGTLGTGAKYPMLLTSIGEGTVRLYCHWVIRAVREFGLKSIGWPNAERKEAIKAGFKRLCGLDGIVGALDGSLMGLTSKPRILGNAYISRKGTPSVTVQAIVDHEGQFIAFESGLPGSQNDTTVWKISHVYQKHRQYFKPGEFLLADGGYPLSSFVLIPFDRRELAVDGQRRREFNHKIAHARVVIERTFGRLKARFPALVKLGPTEDMWDLYCAIEAMMILHNACYDLHDQPDGDIDDFIQDRIDNGEEPYDFIAQEAELGELVNDEGVDIDDSLAGGRLFRNRCMDLICAH